MRSMCSLLWVDLLSIENFTWTITTRNWMKAVLGMVLFLKHGICMSLTSACVSISYALCKLRYVYFICDIPHLLKTVRNCWSHPSFNGSRLLQVSVLTITVELCSVDKWQILSLESSVAPIPFFSSIFRIVHRRQYQTWTSLPNIILQNKCTSCCSGWYLHVYLTN